MYTPLLAVNKSIVCAHFLREKGELFSSTAPKAMELLPFLQTREYLFFFRRPEEAGKVVSPLMTSESIELLRSSLTAKETELWQSLGPAWTLSRFYSFSITNHFRLVGCLDDDPHWTSRKNSLELIELSSINKVSLV